MGQRKRLEGVGVDGRGAPRRWSRNRHRKPIPYGVRLGAIILATAFAVYGSATLLMHFIKPYQRQAVQEKQIAQLSTQLAGINAGNADLQHKIDVLNTQEGIETAAREQRFVEPGEVVVNVQATQTAPANPVADLSFGARLKRAWDGLTGR